MDRPLHPNDAALIRQLALDARKRYDALIATDSVTTSRKTNLLIVIARIGATLAQRELGIDLRLYTY